MTNTPLIAFYAFTSRVWMSLSVDETPLPRKVNLTCFKDPLFWVKMSPLWWRHMYSVLSAFTLRPMPPAASSRLWRKFMAWVGVLAKRAVPSTQSTSLIVCARYLLFLFFCSLKPLFFTISIDVGVNYFFSRKLLKF